MTFKNFIQKPLAYKLAAAYLFLFISIFGTLVGYGAAAFIAAFYPQSLFLIVIPVVSFLFVKSIIIVSEY